MSATIHPLHRVGENYPGTHSERQLADSAARRTLFAARELRVFLKASQRTNEIRHPEQDEILRLLKQLEAKGACHVA